MTPRHIWVVKLSQDFENPCKKNRILKKHGKVFPCVSRRKHRVCSWLSARRRGKNEEPAVITPPLFFSLSDFSWWQWRGDECADPTRSPTALQPHAFLTVPRPRPHCSDPARSPTALQPPALLTVPRPITVNDNLEKLQTPVFKKKMRYHEWRALVNSRDDVLNKRKPSVGGEGGGWHASITFYSPQLLSCYIYIYIYIYIMCMYVCVCVYRCERGESSSSDTDRDGVLRWTPNASVRCYVLMEPKQGLNRASFFFGFFESFE